jgi:hypothetical protein
LQQEKDKKDRSHLRIKKKWGEVTKVTCQKAYRNGGAWLTHADCYEEVV